MTPSSIALLADYLEEGWPSMDLAAEMLAVGLRGRVDVRLLRPGFRPRFTRIRLPGRMGALGVNADRFLNRFWDYPRWLRRRGLDSIAAFHVCDHSYAHLVRSLPPGRAGVYVHDLDTFRCLIEPARDPRPRWFRAMARRILSGVQEAAVVFHSTRAVREELLRFGLVERERLVQAPFGPAPEFRPDGDDPVDAPTVEGRYVLHVGSLIRRKRIDVLLEAFAAATRGLPEVRLVQVGPPWTPEHLARIERLDLRDRVIKRTGLDRAQLAALYRRADLVVLPSDAEGFGLPVLEALACAAAVLASDLPTVREVGGEAVCYAPPGDVEAWAAAIRSALTAPERLPSREVRLARAEEFSWARHAATVLEGYGKVLGA